MKNLEQKRLTFFANRDGKGGATEQYAMALLGIIAEYRPVGGNEIIYLSRTEDSRVVAHLARKTEEEKDGGTGSVTKVSELNEHHHEWDVYRPIVETALDEVGVVAQQAETMTLSESIIDDQLISGSHTHTVTLDPDGIGTTSEEAGHTHIVERGNGFTYVSRSPVDIAGMQLMHTHLPIITPKE